MSRRRGTCPGAALTKTEQLRQARTAAVLRDFEQKQEALKKRQEDPFKVRRRITRPEPKKVDFSKPTMTKTMLARVKQAEKFKQEYERKREALTSGRVPQRAPAPVGGDARMGRLRSPPRGRRTPHVSPPRTLPARREFEAGPSQSVPFRRTVKSPITKKTTELAKLMNADVVQAEPVGTGPINNIVIPPGIVNDERTTIVNISQPTADIQLRETSQVANRSIQVISETLDEQDAAESAAVQSRLSELQQARRDFVIAVANVGGNAVHLDDETPPLFPDSPPVSPLTYQPVQRQILRVPELHDEYLQPEYGLDHPDVIAAREYMQKAKADMEAREAARRMEEEFERIAAAEHVSDELQLDIPFEEEIFQEKDISWEEDESGMAMPHPSRVKAHIPPIPKGEQLYQYKSFDPEELEKFFDLQAYPPCAPCGPPAGREHLHPDLWELEDPWYKAPTGPDMPDLIEFDVSDLIKFD